MILTTQITGVFSYISANIVSSSWYLYHFGIIVKILLNMQIKVIQMYITLAIRISIAMFWGYQCVVLLLKKTEQNYPLV